MARASPQRCHVQRSDRTKVAHAAIRWAAVTRNRGTLTAVSQSRNCAVIRQMELFQPCHDVRLF